MQIPDELMGARVSLRYQIRSRGERPLYSDAVGELHPAEGGTVVVQTRRGPVRVEREAVVAVRAVPPAPPRRASLGAIQRLERLCAQAWPAPTVRSLGEWWLRAGEGYAARANSCLAIGDPGVPVAAALEEVRRFAHEHGIRPRVHVPVGSPWERAVADQGWVLDAEPPDGAEVAVLVAPLDDKPDPRVELPERPSDEWWRRVLGGLPTPAQRHVLDPGGHPPTVFALLRAPAGPPLAHARAAVVEDHLHLSMLEVTPATRRQGLASALLGAVGAWGRKNGARWSVLQVALENSGARAFYAHLGHIEHHRYRYLTPPG